MSAAVLTILSLCALPLAGAALLGAIAYRIATGCRHKWETMAVASRYETAASKMPYGTRAVLRCARCGTLRKKEF